MVDPIFLSGEYRIWIQEGEVGCGARPFYKGRFSLDNIQISRSSAEFKSKPVVDRLGVFENYKVVYSQPGENSITLKGCYDPRDKLFAKLLSNSCPFTIYLHFGKCQDPKSFSDFDFGFSLESAYVRDYSITNLDNTTTSQVIEIEMEVVFSSFCKIFPKYEFSFSSSKVVNRFLIVEDEIKSCDNCSEEPDYLGVSVEDGQICVYEIDRDFAQRPLLCDNCRPVTCGDIVLEPTSCDGVVSCDGQPITCFGNYGLTCDDPEKLVVVDSSFLLCDDGTSLLCDDSSALLCGGCYCQVEVNQSIITCGPEDLLCCFESDLSVELSDLSVIKLHRVLFISDTANNRLYKFDVISRNKEILQLPDKPSYIIKQNGHEVIIVTEKGLLLKVDSKCNMTVLAGYRRQILDVGYTPDKILVLSGAVLSTFENECWSDTQLECSAERLHVVSDDALYLSSSGLILCTTRDNKFADIQFLSDSGVVDIDFVSNTFGYAYSQNTLYMTHDRGITWNSLYKTEVGEIDRVFYNETENQFTLIQKVGEDSYIIRGTNR